MRFLHLRKRKNGTVHAKGGVTVAYEVVGNLVTFATAKCSKRDSYCRKTGRSIAQGRWVAQFVNGNNERHSGVIVLTAGKKPIEGIVEIVRAA